MQHRRQEWGGLYPVYSGAESALDGIIRAETVENLLSVLTERHRRAAVLFYLEQKTKSQVAKELDITAPAVFRILAESLDRMRAGSGTACREELKCVERSLPNGKNTCCGRTAGHSWK